MQTPDESAAFQAVQDAFKQGVNFFDVAPFYAAGKAEEVHTSYTSCLPQYARGGGFSAPGRRGGGPLAG